MDKKGIIVIAVVIVAVFVGGFLLRNTSGTFSSDQGVAGSTSASGIVFYYGPNRIEMKRLLTEHVYRVSGIQDRIAGKGNDGNPLSAGNHFGMNRAGRKYP